MREMKDSGIDWIGEIPENWRFVRLKYTVKQCTEHADGSTGYIGLENIESGFGHKIQKTEDALPEGVTLKIQKDDVLFGKLRPYLSKSYLVQEDGCCSTEFVVMRPQNIHPRFLKYITLAPTFVESINISTYGAKMPRASWDYIGNMLVPLPTIKLQMRIADYLDRKCSQIDAIIARQQEVIEKLKAYKLSVITEAVTKGLNPDVPMKDSGVEWIGEIPEHWEARKLKSIVEIISKGTTPSTIGSELLSYGEIRFLKAENIQNNRVVLEPEFYIDNETHNLLKRSQLQENDILFVIAGATIGKTAILSTDAIPANTNQAVSFIRLKEKDDSKYVWYYLQSSYVKTILNLLSVQSAQPNLSMEDMGNSYLCYPSKEERNLITEYLDKKCGAIESSIEYKQKVIEQLTAYKKSLIYEVVTGKKEV